MTKKLSVLGTNIILSSYKNEDYISLTDIARYKDKERTDQVIQNWLRNYSTIEFLGQWEILNNLNFKPLEFEGFRKQAGFNSFVMTSKKWIEHTNAIGLISKSGRYGGTLAHKDIAIEFASWISVKFKLYLIKEFQRLKNDENERKELDWNLRRSLVKINYEIHTDAIKNHLIPNKISKNAENIIYASEADILNIALFGFTAKEWKDKHPNLDGNVRDYADISQLVCLSNLENLNALFIKEGMPKLERLKKLNAIAIEQMTLLTNNKTIKQLNT